MVSIGERVGSVCRIGCSAYICIAIAAVIVSCPLVAHCTVAASADAGI